MTTVTALVHAGTLLVLAGASTGMAVYAWRQRRVPGRTEFALFMASVAVWTGVYAVGLLTSPPAWRIPLEAVTWTGRASTPVFFLLFALAYTGHDGHVTRRTVGALFAPTVATLALVWTAQYHGLFWATNPRVAHVEGMALVVVGPGPAFWLSVIYAYVLVAVGAALVVRLVIASDRLYADQSVLLVVGIAAPFVGNVVTVVPPHPLPGFDYTPYAFVVTGLAFGYALFRGRLLEMVPATRTLGQATAIDQVDAGILILDGDRRVIYCNAVATEVLDSPAEVVLGRELRSIVDVSALEFGVEEALTEIEREDRVYEVRTSPVTDRSDRPIGHTVVFYDVTARKRRERRLASQRDELERLDDLNATVRSVNQALVSASTRTEIERAVTECLAENDRYRTVCVADVPTWTGEADRWRVAGDADPAPPSVGVSGFETDPHTDDAPSGSVATGSSEDGGSTGSDAPGTHDDRDATDSRATASPTDGDGVGREDGHRSPDIETGRTTAGAGGRESPGNDGLAPTADGGAWCVVPLGSGRTVYGALGLLTDREQLGEREHEILGELGAIVGHAIDAAEVRQLLSTDATVELELERSGDADPLVEATRDGSRLSLAGLVPSRGEGTVAYLRVDGGDVGAVGDDLASTASGSVRVLRAEDDGGLLEWRAPSDCLLGTLVDRGNVREIEVGDGDARYVVETLSAEAARSLADRLRASFPSATVLAKRERTGPAERGEPIPAERLDDLTDRQRESLEAAYRAGYFDSPRVSTAEEVAESLDIASPTLHTHLRKAQDSLLADLFEDGEEE